MVMFFRGEHSCAKFWEKIDVDGELAARCTKCGKITTLRQMYQEAELGGNPVGRRYISDTFDLQMIGGKVTIEIENCTLEDVRLSMSVNEFEFIVESPDMAAIVANQIGKTTEEVFKRKKIALIAGDILYAPLVLGGTLPEGSTTLPKDLSLVWKRVKVN